MVGRQQARQQVRRVGSGQRSRCRRARRPRRRRRRGCRRRRAGRSGSAAPRRRGVGATDDVVVPGVTVHQVDARAAFAVVGRLTQGDVVVAALAEDHVGVAATLDEIAAGHTHRRAG